MKNIIVKRQTRYGKISLHQALGLLMTASEEAVDHKGEIHVQGEPLYDILNGSEFRDVKDPSESSSFSSVQGYLEPDMNKLSDDKQSRVLAYIALALAPCLLLIPFFMSRDFVPADIP